MFQKSPEKIVLKFVLVASIFSMAMDIFPQQSKLSINVNSISEYIASFESNTDKGDLQIVDSIFVFSVRQNCGDTQEALLALAFACVPYREVPIQIPLVGSIVNYPLISADEKTFLEKNEKLPRYLYFDSPQNEYGDKDKCAHFFGSAYLMNGSTIFDLGNLIGYFVEVFEAEFKVQSSIDLRDMQTNKLGQLFGSMLKENDKVRPSHILIQPTLFYIRPTQ
ncbi:MAG: hypothetical protein IPM56_05575 [Ignavibacteriales bacterium]|nr:MAG: hypothetical protein IPM56_05575 [Ignavibacteriales bacterium]